MATVHHHPFHYLLFDTESWIGGPVATILFYIESYSTFYSTLIFHDCPYLPTVRVYGHYTYTDFLRRDIGDLRREDCFGFTFGWAISWNQSKEKRRVDSVGNRVLRLLARKRTILELVFGDYNQGCVQSEISIGSGTS